MRASPLIEERLYGGTSCPGGPRQVPCDFQVRSPRVRIERDRQFCGHTLAAAHAPFANPYLVAVSRRTSNISGQDQ